MPRRVMRRLMVLAAVVAGTVAVFGVFRPDRALRVATAVVAHDICSKTFVSGLDPAAVFAETMTRPGLATLGWAMRFHLDRPTGTVQASLLGRALSRAVYRDGLGCIDLHANTTPVSVDTGAFEARWAALSPPLLPDIAGPAVVEPTDARLKAALDQAFAEPPSPPLRRTKAVVVVHEGQVIAERYAPGVGIDTPLMGFSLTKSVVSALAGILVRDGRLDISKPAPIPAWASPGDPRRAITTEHLMRMSSGLALDETNSGYDVSSRMVYLSDDIAAAAAGASAVAPPGSRWAYSSPSTHLLARVIQDKVGGRPEQILEFAWRELFAPLGMRSVTLEFDAAGTLVGSSYMFASVRDWARFGELYRLDGMVGGRRILPDGWVDFSARATLDTDYGAGFWTNRTAHPRARTRIERGIPADAFMASGNLGQRIVIVPSRRLVVVRLGDAVDPTGDARGLADLVRAVIAAINQ